MKQKTTRRPEGRINIFSRHSPGGILPHKLLIFFLLLAVQLTTPAFLVSCSIMEDIFKTDDIRYSPIAFNAGKEIEVDSLDIFIYRDEEIRKLEYHVRLPYRGSTGKTGTDTLVLTPGGKVAVAAANLGKRPDASKLESYETLELMTIDYEDDNPERPVMSGMTVFTAGEKCEIELRPLLCTIILSEVSNNLSGYTRLEDPRCYLESACKSAELFRETGFRPSEFIGKTPEVPLPCDVGLLTQYPDSHLYCYPNDSQESTIGTPRTSFVLECEIRGKTCRFSTELPALTRACTHTVELTVNSEKDCSFKIF